MSHPFPDDTVAIEDLGRKARARLEQENRNRREIVRLEASDANHPLKHNHNAITISARKKRKRPTAGRKQQQQPSTNTTVDTRVPLVEHLTVAVNTKKSKTSSDVVRLYGLPLATKCHDVVRFFSGLDVVQVFALPCNSAFMKDWDATENSRGKVLVERHPAVFRTFVQFARPPVAALAALRSGETLYSSCSTSDGEGRQGANIAVTQMSKQTAKYLLHNMSIPILQSKISLEDALVECEENLPEIVPKILWTAAIQRLGLQFSDLDKDLCYAPFVKTNDQQSASTLVQLDRHLRKDHDTLTRNPQASYASVAMKQLCCCGPSWMRLTNLAAQLLRDRAIKLQRYLSMVNRVVQSKNISTCSGSSVLKTLMERQAAVAAKREAQESVPDPEGRRGRRTLHKQMHVPTAKLAAVSQDRSNTAVEHPRVEKNLNPAPLSSATTKTQEAASQNPQCQTIEAEIYFELDSSDESSRGSGNKNKQEPPPKAKSEDQKAKLRILGETPAEVCHQEEEESSPKPLPVESPRESFTQTITPAEETPQGEEEGPLFTIDSDSD